MKRKGVSPAAPYPLISRDNTSNYAYPQQPLNSGADAGEDTHGANGSGYPDADIDVEHSDIDSDVDVEDGDSFDVEDSDSWGQTDE